MPIEMPWLLGDRLDTLWIKEARAAGSDTVQAGQRADGPRYDAGRRQHAIQSGYRFYSYVGENHRDALARIGN